MKPKKLLTPAEKTSNPVGKTLMAAEPTQQPGAPSEAWNDFLAKQALEAIWDSSADPKKRADRRNAVLDALDGLSPRDEIEGMIAVQMIASQSAVMECLRRAMIPSQTTLARGENLGHAAKLMQAFARLTDAFGRHRGKGRQKITVEHVHVHAGGQAVVGVVEAGEAHQN